MSIKHIHANGLEFDCRVSGKDSDELVIFLHGFPESSYMWKDIINEVASNGFYCVAPNMRGYSQGARPKGKKNYTLDKLCHDVFDIASTLGQEKFHIVAHDWGAVIGWHLAHLQPERILSFSALSVPHIRAFGYALLNDKTQQKKSRYIKNFQIPFLPEMSIRKGDFKLFRRLWKHSSKDEEENYLSIFRNRKALTAALNYYRANLNIFKTGSGDVKVPTLFIWGNKDLAIGRVGVEQTAQYMKGYYKFLELDAGHWLIQTKYDVLKTEIEAHLLKFKLNCK